jgi:CBS domain containing-hemolysin-like protein
MSVASQLVIAFFLVVLNGFFVGAEFALVKVRSTRLAELSNEGKGAARMALHAVQHFDVYLSATQLGITLASLALGAISEPAVGELLKPLLAQFKLSPTVHHVINFAVALSTVSVFHMVVGELVPKSLAIQRPEALALAVAYPLHAFYWLFRPAIFVINGLSRLVFRLFRLTPTTQHDLSHSEEELRMILTASSESGVLKDSEVHLVEQVFQFADKVATDVMVPRVDMVYMDATWPVEKNLEIANSHTYTRYPLCEGDPDHVIGMIHVRDFLRWAYTGRGDIREFERSSATDAASAQATDPPEVRDIRDIHWEIMFVPETKSIDHLLREFQFKKMHMAIVVDEYGGTAGMLTLEDVVEEIVGEIYDEKEERRPEVQPEGADRFMVDGKVSLADLKADFQIELPTNGSETVAGWVLDHLGSIPDVGAAVESDGYRLEVQEMDGQRVRKVLIVRTAPSDEAAETPALKS